MKALTIIGAIAAVLVLSLPATASERATVSTVQPIDVKFKQPADNTLYTCAQLTVPAGSWHVSYRAIVYSSRPSSDTGTVDAFAVLTTTPGGIWTGTTPLSETVYVSRAGGNLFRMAATASGEQDVTFTVPTTLYLDVFESSGGNWDSLQCLGASWSPTRIDAVAR